MTDASPALESWIGRSEQVADAASQAQALALAATLDRDASGLAPGDPLPPLCGVNWPPLTSGSVVVGVGFPLVSYTPAASSNFSTALFQDKPTRPIHLFDSRFTTPSSMPL